MTVVFLRDRKDAEAVEVAFSESARFYILPRQHAQFARILRQLREAMEQKSVVRVLVDYPEGDMIHDARTAERAGEEPT